MRVTSGRPGDPRILPLGPREQGFDGQQLDVRVPVILRSPEHPAVADLPTAWQQGGDEFWHAGIGAAEEWEFLVTAWLPVISAHEPILGTVRYGKGRVFVTLLGHDAEAMRDPGFRHTLTRGAAWAATIRVRIKVPADSPKTLSPADLANPDH